MFSRPNPSRATLAVLFALNGGENVTSPFFKHPRGTVTTHALPSKTSPVLDVTTTPPTSPSPSTRVIASTATPNRTSNPFANVSVTTPYPPLIMRCAPPNPPYASSWFQCAMDTLDRGAEHPYSRLAQCHPSKRRSEADRVSFSSFSSVRFSFASAASAATAAAFAVDSPSFPASFPPYRSRSSASMTCSSERCFSASAPSRSTRRRAWSIRTSRAFSARASVASSTRAPVFKSNNGNASRSVVVSSPSFRATAKLGSARTPSHGRAVRRFGSAFVPVTIEAPKSIGTERGLLSVFAAHVNTRPPTRARASSTKTSCPSARIARAAASPAGPAPTTITGFVGSGLTPFVVFDAAFASAEAASVAFFAFSSPTPSNELGSARNLVTAERITSLRSLKSRSRSASTAARIWRSVVLFMSAPRRNTTVRSTICESETSAEAALRFSASRAAAAAARAAFAASPASRSAPFGHPKLMPPCFTSHACVSRAKSAWSSGRDWQIASTDTYTYAMLHCVKMWFRTPRYSAIRAGPPLTTWLKSRSSMCESAAASSPASAAAVIASVTGPSSSSSSESSAPISE